MGFKQEFSLLLKARYPLIYLPTFEEDRIEYTIRKYAKLTQGQVIYTWDFVDGYRNNPNNAGYASRNPLQALEFIEKLTDTTPVIFLLKDFEFPDSNKNPVLLFTIVSLDPPMSLAIIGFFIDCASTATLPNASGSIDVETTISET